MKVVTLLFLSLFCFCLNTKAECEATNPSAALCKTIEVEDTPKTMCCYVEFIQNENVQKHCYVFGNSTGSINNYKKYQLKEMSNIKIECSSSSIQYVFSFILLFLFI